MASMSKFIVPAGQSVLLKPSAALLVTAPVVVVDAGQPAAHVLADLRRVVWERL